MAITQYMISGRRNGAVQTRDQINAALSGRAIIDTVTGEYAVETPLTLAPWDVARLFTGGVINTFLQTATTGPYAGYDPYWPVRAEDYGDSSVLLTENEFITCGLAVNSVAPLRSVGTQLVTPGGTWLQVGNSVSKLLDDGSWVRGVRSAHSIAGVTTVSAYFPEGTDAVFGLVPPTFEGGISNPHYAWHVTSGGGLLIDEDGIVALDLGATWTFGDKLEIRYTEDGHIRYYQNDVLKRDHLASHGTELSFGALIYQIERYITGVEFDGETDFEMASYFGMSGQNDLLYDATVAPVPANTMTIEIAAAGDASNPARQRITLTDAPDAGTGNLLGPVFTSWQIFPAAVEAANSGVIGGSGVLYSRTGDGTLASPWIFDLTWGSNGFRAPCTADEGNNLTRDPSPSLDFTAPIAITRDLGDSRTAVPVGVEAIEAVAGDALTVEEQNVVIYGRAGTFTVEDSDPLPYNVSAEDFKDALDLALGLSIIDTVTELEPFVLRVVWLIPLDQPLLTLDDSGLTLDGNSFPITAIPPSLILTVPKEKAWYLFVSGDEPEEPNLLAVDAATSAVVSALHIEMLRHGAGGYAEPEGFPLTRTDAGENWEYEAFYDDETGPNDAGTVTFMPQVEGSTPGIVTTRKLTTLDRWSYFNEGFGQEEDVASLILPAAATADAAADVWGHVAAAPFAALGDEEGDNFVHQFMFTNATYDPAWADLCKVVVADMRFEFPLWQCGATIDLLFVDQWGYVYRRENERNVVVIDGETPSGQDAIDLDECEVGKSISFDFLVVNKQVYPLGSHIGLSSPQLAESSVFDAWRDEGTIYGRDDELDDDRYQRSATVFHLVFEPEEVGEFTDTLTLPFELSDAQGGNNGTFKIRITGTGIPAEEGGGGGSGGPVSLLIFDLCQDPEASLLW